MLVVDAGLAVELALDRMGEQASTSLDVSSSWLRRCSGVRRRPCSTSLRFVKLSRELAGQALKRFVSGEIKVTERRHDRLSLEAWRIAGEFGWAKTYDAEYLALAHLLDCRLVTLDARLRRGADRLGFVVTPLEL